MKSGWSLAKGQLTNQSVIWYWGKYHHGQFLHRDAPLPFTSAFYAAFSFPVFYSARYWWVSRGEENCSGRATQKDLTAACLLKRGGRLAQPSLSGDQAGLAPRTCGIHHRLGRLSESKMVMEVRHRYLPAGFDLPCERERGLLWMSAVPLHLVCFASSESCSERWIFAFECVRTLRKRVAPQICLQELASVSTRRERRNLPKLKA